jgi:serine/threonine-protein kinase
MRTGGRIRRFPAGSVVQQDPTPGSHVRRQRSIHVWVSQGEEVIVVPSLVGDSERSAEVRLAQGGLKLAGTAEVRSHDYAPDAVIRAGSGAGHARRDGRAAGEPRRCAA